MDACLCCWAVVIETVEDAYEVLMLEVDVLVQSEVVASVEDGEGDGDGERDWTLRAGSRILKSTNHRDLSFSPHAVNHDTSLHRTSMSVFV